MVEVPTSYVIVGERHRSVCPDAVDRLAASMADIGLRHPITVRIVDGYVTEDGEVCDGAPVLVAGAHRLAAAIKLGWDKIACVDLDGDELAAELWEIAENLHRLDLTKDQRDAHIRRYAELLQSRQNVAIESKRSDGRGHRPEGPASVIARETGLSKRTVERALAPDQPKPVKSDAEVILAQANAIVAAWNRACPEAREMALEQIDGPVLG